MTHIDTDGAGIKSTFARGTWIRISSNIDAFSNVASVRDVAIANGLKRQLQSFWIL